jgi:hypothetical protein
MNGISRFIGSSVFVAALLLAAAHVSAGANLLSNPSFGAGLTDWTVSGAGGNAAILVFGPNPPYNDPLAPISNSANFTNFNASSDLSLSQGTGPGSVVAGEVDYSFDLYGVQPTGNGGTFSWQIWDVPSSGPSSSLGAGTYSIGPDGTYWQAVSGSVTAPAGVDHVIIEFDCTTAAYYSGLYATIDNVSVTQTVPEPTTVTLVGLGLFGVVAFGRKRRA